LPIELYYIQDSGPWGGYGSVLWHGFDAGVQTSIELCRFGPFLPAITLVNNSLVVTEAVAQDFLERFGRDYIFRDVVIKSAVLLDWSSWDLGADAPPIAPGGGNEPEDFILSRRNDPSVAKGFGRLTEIVPPIGAYVDLIRVPVPGTRRGFTLDYRVKIDTRNSSDIFLGSGFSPTGSGPYCTSRLKQ
jgi:hypothetical protein